MSVELKARKKYRRIKNDGTTVIQEGDEWANPGVNDWGPATAMIGTLITSEYGAWYRRPILAAKPAKKVPKPISYQHLAMRMSKAPTIREARAMYERAVGK